MRLISLIVFIHAMLIANTVGFVLQGNIVPSDASLSNVTLQSMMLKVHMEDLVVRESVLIRDFDFQVENGQKFPINFQTDYPLKSTNDHTYRVCVKLSDVNTNEPFYVTQKCQTIVDDVDQALSISVDKLASNMLDSCRLPAKTGMCRGYFKRFYYDPSTNECKQFVYGGCGGNLNNYGTQSECQFVCSS
jgi:hypothetical protein